MNEAPETFGEWFRRKRHEHRPRLSQQEVAERASKFVPMSQTYVSLIERTAGTSDEPDVSPDRIIALAHALGENPTDALALRAHVVPSSAIPEDEELSLPGGGSIVLRGRVGPPLSDREKTQLSAVVDALLNSHRHDD